MNSSVLKVISKGLLLYTDNKLSVSVHPGLGVMHMGGQKSDLFDFLCIGVVGFP